MADPPLTLACFRLLADLPHDALALLEGDAFATPAWYRAVMDAAMPAAARPCFAVVTQGGASLAVWPMQTAGATPDAAGRPAAGGTLAALTTPYTSLWRPLLAPGLPPSRLRAIGRAFGRFCRGHATVRLDCLDLSSPAWGPLTAGLTDAGLRVLPFSHFGNWHASTAGQDWHSYLAARPGALREAIRRRTSRLTRAGASCAIVTGGPGLDHAITAYESVYAKSWKAPEPFPHFAATLIRAAASRSALRLGLLTLHGEPIAAQIWITHGPWAGVLKLAHDEAHKAASPGTVLTAHMIRHALETDHAAELDFGRGDDPYKKDWAPLRRPRAGLLLANPWRPAGLAAVARSLVRGVVRKARPGGAAPWTPAGDKSPDPFP